MKGKLIANFIDIMILMIVLPCFASLTDEKKIIKHTNYIPYYLEVYKADDLYKKKNYQICLNVLENLFNNYEPLNQELYYEYEKYVKTSVILNNKIDYKKTISKLIQDFGYEKKIFKGDYKDSLLAKAYIKSNLTDIDFEVLRNKYIKSKNFTLRDTIIEMNKADQLYRHGEDYQKYSGRIDSIARINERKLIYIFEKYGFPNDKIIGNRAIRGKREPIMIDAILIHMASSKKVAFFKKELLLFVKQGKCPPLFYASLIDRECLNMEKKQIYYTFQKNENLSLEYMNEINSNRKKIGLEAYKQ